jgi:hypothetical protein
VLRRSDAELFERLERREPCYVLAPRQIGKSSLRVRTQDRLRAKGVRCVSVDLTSIGSGASASEWYFSVASAIAEQIGVEPELDAFWAKHRRMSPVRRFRQFLHDVALEGEEPEARPLVVFVDEIDVTLSLPFSRDDFFGLIRSAHEARTESPRWQRMTFCLIGVAAPLDPADPERTPFNNSYAVRITIHAHRGETPAWRCARARSRGAAGGGARSGGHPALTQRLCTGSARAPRMGARRRIGAVALFLPSGLSTIGDCRRRALAGDRPDA